MEPEFWLERWQAGQTGFHRDVINDHLKRFWPGLGVKPGSRILVPLCGKSLDLLWLADQGHPVVGIEISRIAVESFFSDNRLPPVIHEEEYGLRYSSGELEILYADFFALDRQDIGTVHAFYDSAALIALTAAQRPDYVAHLETLLDPGTRGLLITLAYNQPEMSGPPFSVTDDEVQRLYSSEYRLKQLFSFDALTEYEQFRERGLSALSEQVFRLARR